MKRLALVAVLALGACSSAAKPAAPTGPPLCYVPTSDAGTLPRGTEVLRYVQRDGAWLAEYRCP